MDDLLEALARLDARLEQVEQRLCALECLARGTDPRALPSATPAIATSATGEFALPQPGGVFPIIGKAMLGIAGAYLLRAIAESGSFPKLAIVVLALAYAGTWLAWASRASVRLASTAYAATAALILVPMLAELTLRFQVLPASVTAAILTGFVLAASALAWKRNLTTVIWVAAVTGVFTTLALLVASRAVVPYLLALLVMAAGCESATLGNRWLRLRILVIPAVDLAVWILISVGSSSASSRSEYAAVPTPLLLALPALLLLTYGSSIALRTIVLGRRITILEIIQTIASFVLAGISWRWFTAGPGLIGFGIFCGLLSAVCYAVVFTRFDRAADQRNYHVYAAWSAALLLLGSFLVLSPQVAAVFLCLLSVIVTLVGVRLSRLTLEFHGLLYLTMSALASGLLQYAAQALAGTVPGAPGWAVCIVAASAIACYALDERFQGDGWKQRLLRLLSAIFAVSAAAALLVSALVWLTGMGMSVSAFHIAIIRTLIICAFALALAYSGARWQRLELIWIAYGELAFVTAKLLFEDLPRGRSGSIAISIFLYAVALIMVPRVGRVKPAKRNAAASSGS